MSSYLKLLPNHMLQLYVRGAHSRHIRISQYGQKKVAKIKQGSVNSVIYQQHQSIHQDTAMQSAKITLSRKPIMDYSRYLNEVGSKRKPSLIREMTKILTTSAQSGTIFLAAGMPNSDLFPFQSMTFEMNDGSQFKVKDKQLKAALQYQPTLGYPPLLESLRSIQQKYHNITNWDNTDIIVTVGSQHGLCAVIEMMVDKGDPIIVPAPVYSSALTIMDPYSPVYIGVPTDSEGMQPKFLKSMLEKWASSNNHERMPKILYINPIGANPDGTSGSTERKKEIYQIAQLYDLLILEDDPYYFLHFEQENPSSLLSMDVDGRVIRLDSFSKVLSSGLRIGFATGPKEIVRFLELSVQASVLHAASLSQVVVDGVLREWKSNGFESHIDNVRKVYKDRRDKMVEAAKEHLTGLAEWHVPKGGMFLWMKVLGVKDTYEMVMKHGMNEKILMLPGREFFPDRTAPCPFLRAAFSIVPLDDMNKGMERLAKLIRDEQKRQ